MESNPQAACSRKILTLYEGENFMALTECDRLLVLLNISSVTWTSIPTSPSTVPVMLSKVSCPLLKSGALLEKDWSKRNSMVFNMD
jgi:hypothetical protein